MASDARASVVVSLAVMHAAFDPRRKSMLTELLPRLAGDWGSVSVIEDHDRVGPWPTARRAWLSAAPDATHHVVVQDDVLPCERFFEHMRAALAAAPDSMVCAYSNNRLAQAPEVATSSWVYIPDNAWGQCLAMPSSRARHYVEWCDQVVPASYPHDDGRFHLYACSQGLPVLCTQPSLVDHLGADSSTLGHRGRFPQRARVFEAQISPTKDWSLGLQAAHRVTEKGFAAQYERRMRQVRKWDR